MIPVVELRGGLPVGIASGLPFPMAYLAAVLGNILPVPFIIIFIQKIFAWLRKHWSWMDGFVTKMEKRAESKRGTVEKYGPWGLLIFVAIPAPGTGAWTGALIAALMNMELKKAFPVIVIGVCIAGLLVSGLTYGVIHVF
ncbi:MAG: small multi-drug export protein [Oscillospiraceae bacterium]|nr:small multi-drug export protein [Oscillospiraceae bacterium]